MKPGEITEERRRAILWILWVHGPGNPASITAMYREHVEAGRLAWGDAPWGGAVPTPYETGIRQHLESMCRPKDRRVVKTPDHRGYDWNREVLKPRAHAAEVLEQRSAGWGNAQIAVALGINSKHVSGLYSDPFGLREKERKERYCGGCGAPKKNEQGRCVNCVRKARLEREDNLESLLPDPAWATGLPVVLPVDFGVTDDGRRLLIVHTERGKLERQLRRGESWEHAVEDAGVLRV